MSNPVFAVMRIVVVLLFFAFVPATGAQTVEPIFDGVAEITLPEGAELIQSGFRQSKRYSIFLPSVEDGVTVQQLRLPKARQKWSDARWARYIQLYYRSPKNKRKYRFRDLITSADGNVVSTEVQLTLKEGRKRRTYRLAERMIRVDKATVIMAFFLTDKLGSWNNEESIALRNVVTSLSAVR